MNDFCFFVLICFSLKGRNDNFLVCLSFHLVSRLKYRHIPNPGRMLANTKVIQSRGWKAGFRPSSGNSKLSNTGTGSSLGLLDNIDELLLFSLFSFPIIPSFISPRQATMRRPLSQTQSWFRIQTIKKHKGFSVPRKL